MKDAAIVRARPEDEFETAERCSILELSNDAGDEAVSVARATVRPGVTTEWHKLVGVAERYVILSGRGLVEVEGLERSEVKVGAVVRIPPGVPQRITNVGEDVLVFLAICSPRFTRGCYVGL